MLKMSISRLLVLSTGLALTASATADVFEDVTLAAGITGLNSSWGSAWADLDNDGDLDIISTGHVQPHTASVSQIWQNNGDETFTDITLQAGYLKENGDAHGVVAADFDNDGNQDFYMVKGSTKTKPEHEHDLMMSNGDGTFTNVAATGGVLGVSHRGRGGYSVDYDVDGDLDIFFTSFDRGRGDFGNMLFRNDGNNTWVDVAPAAGIARDDNQNRTASWADYNNDGYPDLFVMYPCTLYANQGDGTFIDVTAAAGIVSTTDCSSSAWNDYDRDGDLDVYITSGGDGTNPQSTEGFLYRNNNDGTFTDVTLVSASSNSADARGVVWGDYDNDGWSDLYIVNNSNSNPNRLLKNNANGSFSDVTIASNSGAMVTQGAGVDATFADFNNDGSLDLFIANGRASTVGEYLLLKNTGNLNNWLMIDLVGVTTNRDGHMSRVIVTSALGSQMLENNGPSHYMNQDSSPLHFGLGADNSPVTVRIEWADGSVQTLKNVAANQQLSITQDPDADAPAFTLVSQSAGISTDLKVNYGNPIWGDMNNDDYLDLIVPAHAQIPGIYINNKDGSFTQKGVLNVFGMEYFNEHNDFHGYSFTDFNNDNILDLFITMGARQGDENFTKRDLLYQGNGNGTFEMVSSLVGVENPTGRGRSSCWFDYNGDGRLDFLLKNLGTDNAFYLNSISNTFTDIAPATGLSGIQDGAVCSLVDFDNDGLMDIFLNSEGLDNTLMRQLPDGTFSDVTAASNITTTSKSRGVAWGDYNNDGLMDLYIAVGASSSYSGPMSALDLNNTLYTNNGDGSFTDSTVSAGLQANFNTAVAAWGDVNNDGNLDLFVTNAGEVSGGGNRNFLYINNGNGKFTESAVQANLDGEDGLLEHRYTSAALADYDNDGFLDVVVNGGSLNLTRGTTELYHNEGNDNNYLKIVPRGVRANAPAIGSVVSVSTASGEMQLRQHTGATSGVRSSQSVQPVHFGLGASDVASVAINWPEGARVASQTIDNVATNQTITLVEGRSIVRGMPQSTMDKGCYVWRNYLGWSLRCIGDAGPRVEFSGVITSNGEITSVDPLNFEPNDSVTNDASSISFNLFARQGQDTIGFTTTGDTVTFDIYLDGSHQPANIRIGQYEVVPGTLPVTLTE